MERPVLPATLADEVLAAVGSAMPRDRAGVEQLYRAWVAAVPFDPVAKALALAGGTRPPGDDPTDVVERWLATGIGSTCWGHATVLQALLDRAGAPSTIALDRMHSERVDFHCLLLVDLDGERLALDPIHVSGGLLPWVPGARGTHPAYEVGVDDGDDGRRRHWFVSDATDRPIRSYSTIAEDLDLADVRTFLAISTTHSGVGKRFFLRRVLGDRVERFRVADDGRALLHQVRHHHDWTTEELPDVDQAIAAAGLHGPAVDQLVAARLLDPTAPIPWLGAPEAF